MLKSLIFYCALIVSTTMCNSLSILLVEAVASTSHHIWMINILKGLLHKGHHVHVVSIHETNIKGELAENLTQTVFTGIMENLHETKDFNPNEFQKQSTMYISYFVFYWGHFLCERTIETKEAKELLQMIKNTKFDVIVQDVTTHQCLYGLWEVAKDKPPVVGFLPFGLAPYLNDYIGGSDYPTVRPYSAASFAKPEGLWQKTWNTFNFIMSDLIRHYYYMPISQEIAERYVGHKIRPLHELEKNITFLLINTHPAFEPAIPLPPNALEIGGVHAQSVQQTVNEKTEIYPDSIREFLDGAENGAVIVSLGTNVNWRSIELDKLQAVTRALSRLEQRVLWKIDIEVPFEMSNNVMVVKWLPQNEVLGHKNVKAIWTHGGLLSTQEAIWKGVPMIGMPFFMDQKPNVAIIVEKGIGVKLDFDTLSTETILDAFEKILKNDSYAKNMKRFSSEFRDRPVPPVDLAVWSIEYTARHPHGNLESALKYQSWIERNLIDVYAFLFLNLIIISLVIVFLLKKICKFCCDRLCTASKLQKHKQM